MTTESVARFELNGRTMVYSRIGSDIGTPFVLVHGIGMGRGAYSDFARELGAFGPVFAIDLPGFGDSPEPESPLDVPASGAYVAAFIATLGIADPVLIGHSMGAQIVVEILRLQPGLASRAVLIGPTVNPSERTPWQQALRLLQDLAGERLAVLVTGMVEYAKTGPVWFLKKLRPVLEHRMEESLPFVTARVLVLRGSRDRVSPRSWARRVARLVPGAAYAEIRGHGHEAIVRDPTAAVNEITMRLDCVAQ